MRTLFALALLAATLGRFRDWADSPQGYFMTKAERAAWSRLTTEGDAEQFVKAFLASRGPRFADDVAAAAREADARLTVAGKAGSKTLRGRIVILLGPPKTMSIAPWVGDKSVTSARFFTPGRPQAIVNLPPNREPTSEMRKRYSTDYTFTYPSRTIVVAVNPITGDDRILDARAAREAGKLLEAAAEASKQ